MRKINIVSLLFIIKIKNYNLWIKIVRVPSKWIRVLGKFFTSHLEHVVSWTRHFSGDKNGGQFFREMNLGIYHSVTAYNLLTIDLRHRTWWRHSTTLGHTHGDVTRFSYHYHPFHRFPSPEGGIFTMTVTKNYWMSPNRECTKLIWMPEKKLLTLARTNVRPFQ